MDTEITTNIPNGQGIASSELLADERYKGLPVGLVEGEKSCLIAAWACRDVLPMIWIACGMNTFNVTRLLPIIQQKRRLYIFPDYDQLDKWDEATKKLNYPKAFFMGKFLLKEQKKTSKWLSEELGVSPSTVSKWCTNSSQPDIETLARISKLLNVGVEELFNKKFMESV